MTKWITSSRNGDGKSVYHTDKTCSQIANPMEVTQNEIDYHDLRECKHCSGDVKSGTPAKRKCPDCGDYYKHLGGHLRGCQ